MASTRAIIDSFHREHSELLQFLTEQRQPSFQAAVDAVFAKTLVLAIASYFEVELTEIVRKYVGSIADNHPKVLSLVENKAIKRQYHTWFDWTNTKPNPFFAMFGEECKSVAVAALKADAALAASAGDFINLGQRRNELIHGNFVAMQFEETAMDVMRKFESAVRFVDYVRTVLAPLRSEGPGRAAPGSAQEQTLPVAVNAGEMAGGRSEPS